MMTLENPGLPWLVSSASHRVVLHLFSSGNSQRSASPPTHKATAVNRKEPAENPCKLFSFAHSSLYPGDIKVYSEDDVIKMMVNLRWFKTIASPCLPPAATLVDLEENPPPVLPPSASFSGCQDCPKLFLPDRPIGKTRTPRIWELTSFFSVLHSSCHVLRPKPATSFRISSRWPDKQPGGPCHISISKHLWPAGVSAPTQYCQSHWSDIKHRTSEATLGISLQYGIVKIFNGRFLWNIGLRTSYASCCGRKTISICNRQSYRKEVVVCLILKQYIWCVISNANASKNFLFKNEKFS